MPLEQTLKGVYRVGKFASAFYPPSALALALGELAFELASDQANLRDNQTADSYQEELRLLLEQLKKSVGPSPPLSSATCDIDVNSEPDVSQAELDLVGLVSGAVLAIKKLHLSGPAFEKQLIDAPLILGRIGFVHSNTIQRDLVTLDRHQALSSISPLKIEKTDKGFKFGGDAFFVNQGSRTLPRGTLGEITPKRNETKIVLERDGSDVVLNVKQLTRVESNSSPGIRVDEFPCARFRFSPNNFDLYLAYSQDGQ
ncbi:hypothetical protein Poly51_17580 [Rubripirellula tenax]|uniref:Uncharacterized protein n=1 Tax=Rubripirellula tenax TaxID=2528015 RepID=A0A5C6FE46_9BACT|nr:hypothetical protein [Rubripirellula tenax]TWU58977.1 hypothetical protein Poly51_17580 [Rubripirellula tenax]